MILSGIMSRRVIRAAYAYSGTRYDYKTFDCVHFILRTYEDAGLPIPWFGPIGYPPPNLHLSAEEFERMPLGSTVFLKRKASTSARIWTHMAIIVSDHELIHCSRHFGGHVTVTPKNEFMGIYALAPKLQQTAPS